MQTIFHKANSRGYFNHGWLKTYHSFSFADYYNPEKMNFGLLRVLNDDIIEGGKGFGTHPHKNMEIISVPIYGELAHQDSTGSKGVIKKDQVQVMSAGRGIFHSEFNNSVTEPANFLQIWILPETQDIEPRYITLNLNPELRKGKIHFFAGSTSNNDCVMINQQARVGLAELEIQQNFDYSFEKENQGLYVFLIDGIIKINDIELNKRDAIGVWDVSTFNIDVIEKSNILFLEIPMS